MSCGCGKCVPALEFHGTLDIQQRLVTGIQTTSSVLMPGCNETVVLTFQDLARIQIGVYLWNAGIGWLQVTAFDSANGFVRAKNICAPGNALRGTSIPACTLFNVTPSYCVVQQVSAPGSPEIYQADVGECTDYIDVHFTRPSSDGGTPVIGYIATAYPGGISASGVTSPLRISGLSSGSYFVVVEALNAVGVGCASSPYGPVLVNSCQTLLDFAPDLWYDGSDAASMVLAAHDVLVTIADKSGFGHTGTGQYGGVVKSRTDNKDQRLCYSGSLISWGDGATLSADGTQTSPINAADVVTKVVEWATNDHHRAKTYNTGGSGIPGLTRGLIVDVSIAVKKHSRDWAYLMVYQIGSSSFDYAYFNIDTMTPGSCTAGLSPAQMSIDDLGGGWALLKLTGVAVDVGVYALMGAGLATGDGGGVYVGDGSYMWVASPHICVTGAEYTPTTGVWQVYKSPAASLGLSGLHYLANNPAVISTQWYPDFSHGMSFAGYFLMERQAAVGDPVGWAASAFIANAVTGSADNRMWLSVGWDGTVYAWMFQNATIKIGRKSAAGTWLVNQGHRIVVTYDGGLLASGIKIFIDGVRVDTTDDNASGPFTGIPATTGNYVLVGMRGSLSGGYDEWQGYVGEVAVWQRGVSDVEVSAIDGLLTRWTT